MKCGPSGFSSNRRPSGGNKLNAIIINRISRPTLFGRYSLLNRCGFCGMCHYSQTRTVVSDYNDMLIKRRPSQSDTKPYRPTITSRIGKDKNYSFLFFFKKITKFQPVTVMAVFRYLYFLFIKTNGTNSRNIEIK